MAEFEFSDDVKRGWAESKSDLAETGADLIDAAWAGLMEQNSPGSGSTYLKGRMEKNAKAAARIRERYYAKEFEKVQSVRVSPLKQSLQENVAKLQMQATPVMRPIGHLVTPEQGQIRADALAPDTPKGVQKGADGKPLASSAPQRPANLTESPGPLGGIEYREGLSYIDPATGEAVDVFSSRGFSLEKKWNDEIGQLTSQAATSVMDIYSEYMDNPMISKQAEHMFNAVSMAAGQNATGQQSSEGQAEYMMKNQQAQADLESTRIGTQQKALDLRQSEGKLMAQAQDARNFAGDPELEGRIRPALAAKLRSGKNLTTAELNEAASSATRIQSEIDKAQLRRSTAGLEAIPMDLQAPDQIRHWDAHLFNNDAGFKQYYKQNVNTKATELTAELRQLGAGGDDDALESALVQSGFDKHAINKVLLGDWSDPYVVAAMEQATMSRYPNLVQESMDTAHMKRIPEIYAQQPGVRRAIDSEIEDIISRVDAQKEAEGQRPLTGIAKARMRADKFRVVFENTMERRPTTGYRDRGTIQNLRRLEATEEAVRMKIDEGLKDRRILRETLLPTEAPAAKNQQSSATPSLVGATTIGSHPTAPAASRPPAAPVPEGPWYRTERRGKRERALIERARAYRAKQRGLGE
jgi:hypothetical protein